MRARLLAAFAALMLLAACGGEPSPEPAPYKSSEPQTTSEARSAESAIAFVSAYMETFTEATLTGDVAQLKAMGTSDCLSCKTLIGNIKRIYADGGSATGGGYEAKSFKVIGSPTDDPTVLKGIVQYLPQTQVPSSGASPKKSKGGPAKSQITLRWVDGVWRMFNWEFL